MEKKIELVVFDIAGTTVQDRGEIVLAFQSALRKYGYIVADHDIYSLMGYKKPEAILMILKKFEKDTSKISSSLVDDIHNRFMAMMIRFYVTSEKILPLPYVEEVFADLQKKGIKVALDTGFSKNITDVIIGRLGWLQNKLVDYVISSNEVQAGRPHPYMIQKLMQLAGTDDAKKVIKIGDTESDINEGKNAGCLYSIAVTSGAFARHELEPYHPSFIIDDLQELIPIIEHAL